MAVTPVEPGELATIVTRLEMTVRPRPAPLPASPFRLVRWHAPAPGRYRALFRRVGARWLWYSRLVIDDSALSLLIGDPLIEVYAAIDRAGIEVGMVELDFRAPGDAQIAYFALIPELAGQKIGRWLMAETLARAWRSGIDRVWLNTCSLDHPSAMNFYLACGFKAVARVIETFPDPRAIGILPSDAAPQIPLLATRR